MGMAEGAAVGVAAVMVAAAVGGMGRRIRDTVVAEWEDTQCRCKGRAAILLRCRCHGAWGCRCRRIRLARRDSVGRHSRVMGAAGAPGMAARL